MIKRYRYKNIFMIFQFVCFKVSVSSEHVQESCPRI